MNRTRLMDLFIVDGDCLRRLMRIICSRVRNINVIKIFLHKTYNIDTISTLFTNKVCKAKEAL